MALATKPWSQGPRASIANWQPRKRMMMRALVTGTMTDVDGRRWEVVKGQTQIIPDHPIFQMDPDMRRLFELVDANAEARAANPARVRRAVGKPPVKRKPRFKPATPAKSPTQPPKRRPRRTKYSIPE
jgi:hypothetical protein